MPGLQRVLIPRDLQKTAGLREANRTIKSPDASRTTEDGWNKGKPIRLQRILMLGDPQKTVGIL